MFSFCSLSQSLDKHRLHVHHQCAYLLLSTWVGRGSGGGSYRNSHIECRRGEDEYTHSYERAEGGAPQDSTGKGHKPYGPVIFLVIDKNGFWVQPKVLIPKYVEACPQRSGL